MSSEMREVDAFEAWARAQCFGAEELRRIEGRPANTFGLTWEYNGDSVQAAWAAWLERSLLARTEAGADRPVAEISELSGAKLIVLYSADEIGHLPKGTKLYTHPQDASAGRHVGWLTVGVGGAASFSVRNRYDGDDLPIGTYTLAALPSPPKGVKS